MEELRSTEALDREILEDARKKAFKILKTAEDTLLVQAREWEEKSREALDSIRKTYAEKTKKETEEIFSRLPLDERRLRSESSEEFLLKAMDSFLLSLKRETLLSVLERELAERIDACASACGKDSFMNGADIIYSGLALNEAEELMEHVAGHGDYKFREDLNKHEFPSMTITIQTARINASVEAAAAALLNDKRAELAAALLGEGVLND